MIDTFCQKVIQIKIYGNIFFWTHLLFKTLMFKAPMLFKNKDTEL